MSDLNAVLCTADIDPACGRISAGATLFIGPVDILLSSATGPWRDCLLPGCAIHEGQLNDACLDGTSLAATASTIGSDDNGYTETEYALISSGATKLLLRSKITLDPPLDASRVLPYGKTKSYIGNEVQGRSGTVCSLPTGVATACVATAGVARRPVAATSRVEGEALRRALASQNVRLSVSRTERRCASLARRRRWRCHTCRTQGRGIDREPCTSPWLLGRR